MSKSYIELASGFRNRLLYPNAADFVVNPCETNAENPLENSNNISDAYPFYNFWSLPLNIIKRWDCSPTTQKLDVIVSASIPLEQINETWPTTDCCQPVIITDAYGASGIIIAATAMDGRPVTVTIQLGCEDAVLRANTTPNSATISGGDPANPPTPSTGEISGPAAPVPVNNLIDTGYYKPELVPINYGLDSCNMHRDTQYINNPSVGLTDSSNLQNKLTGCCVGTAGKPVFSNQILPVHTLSNMYNWKIEIDSCKEITSIYNSYASTGLIKQIDGQCCMSRYYDGMVMTNFTTNDQNCNECSTITISSDAATLPTNRCCDIIIPVRMWDKKSCTEPSYPPDGQKIDPCTAYSTYFSIEAAKQLPPIIANSIGCVTACPVTDSVSFDMYPSFTNSFRCIDWFGKDTCWDQIKCEKAQYNPYVVNNQSWNCVRVQGGGPFDANNAYCCSFMEMIPAPINARDNFSYALPGGLSDRFKIVSSYEAATKLASFNAYDCCDSLVQRQWQRMIYWQLYARCGRIGDPRSVYNPDQLCNAEMLNQLANSSSSSIWTTDSIVKGCADSAVKPAEQIIRMRRNALVPVVNSAVCVPDSDLKVGGTLTQLTGVVPNVITKTFRIVELGFPTGATTSRALTPAEGGPNGPPRQALDGGTYNPASGLWITVVPAVSECAYEEADFIQGSTPPTPPTPSPIDSIITVLINGVAISISTSIASSEINVEPNAADAVTASTHNQQAMGAIRTYSISGSISVQNGDILPATGIPGTGGCGCGATFDIEGATCEIDLSQNLSINHTGKNYKIGDKLQILPSSVTTVPRQTTMLKTIGTADDSKLETIVGSIVPIGAFSISNVGTTNVVITGINACGESCTAAFNGISSNAAANPGDPMPLITTTSLLSSTNTWDATAINGLLSFTYAPVAVFIGAWTSALLASVLQPTLKLAISTVSPPIIEGPGIIITVTSVTPTVFWPDIGLASQGTNYIWNYRMRKAMPEVIATANTGIIKNTISYSSDNTAPPSSTSTSTVDYAITTPPLFLFGVPYSVELLTGGSGYRYGGHFIYGVDNCDLFEIAFAVNCGEVVDVMLTKLAIDQTIYQKLLGSNGTQAFSDTAPFATYKSDVCDIDKATYFFNIQIPDIIELNQMGGGGEYSYNWDGQTEASRSQNAWFGGSGACIRINKSYGFFSNLGHTEKTNYANKTSNTPYGPANNDKQGCLLFLPSVAEACNNDLGELRNSLNFSTFSQTNKKYTGSFNTVLTDPCSNPDVTNDYNLKYQIDSQMKFMQQYPKTMAKQVGCQYNYAEPPFNSDSTGTTPIIANYSTQDIPIYWRAVIDTTVGGTPVQSSAIPDWKDCRFKDLQKNTQTLAAIGGGNIKVIQQLVEGSILLTRNAFQGFPLNIDGLWDIAAAKAADDGTHVGWDRNDPTITGEKLIPPQCCAYEWEVLPVTASAIRTINNQLVPKSSTQEQSCWRINLRNLLVPNITLQSGSLASFYPYFYVEFTNVTDVQRQHGMIQSNNPNAKPALFRCAVTDIATPIISKFIKLTGDGMYQTVKFRPNDSLKMKIYLPDGREFMTSNPDTAPPSPANPLLQISALFEAEHIE